jgi:aryl-alcohol dehydrogenase-like predicted oxidoreductase
MSPAGSSGERPQEAEASLRRLKTEHIDLYQIHWPDPDQDIEEAWRVIGELIREGKVRYGGVSNFTTDQIDRVRAIHSVASLQPPYSMLTRGVEETLLPYCANHEIGVIAYSPMQGF